MTRQRALPCLPAALFLVSVSVSALAACADDGAGQDGQDEVGSEDTADTATSDDDATTTTTATTSDESGSTDDGTGSDTDSTSSSSSTDGPPDTGADDDPLDTDSTDSGSTDGGSTDTTTDGGSTDTTTDGGSTDTTTDGGSTDTTDGGMDTTDGDTGDPLTFDNCGYPNDGPWVEIEYWQLGSVSSPSWAFSDTPGWGEPEWAYQGEFWPEVWEFGGNSMNNDPIGIVAEIHGTWQLMLGLQGMASYDYASVCIEGRSVSVGSPAYLDVYNPFNGCGVQDVQISHSWEVHKVGVDLGDCFIPGNGTQALRIEPNGGSGVLGLKRLRLTLHGAVY